MKQVMSNSLQTPLTNTKFPYVWISSGEFAPTYELVVGFISDTKSSELNINSCVYCLIRSFILYMYIYIYIYIYACVYVC